MNYHTNMANNKTIKLTIVGASGIVLVALFVNIIANGQMTPTTKNTTAITANSSNNAASTSNSTSSTTTNTYKDGTYTAKASFAVPHGSNSITVNATIKNNIITAVTTTHTPQEQESQMYDTWFDNAMTAKVVGKAIDQISLSRVGGASLTTSGFNSALENIKSQAAG